MINNLFIIPLEVWVITILLILILPIIIIYLKKHFEIAEISAGPPWIKIVKKKNVVITTPPQIVYHNLPQPDYGHFIGREDEINQIITILRPYPYSQYPIVTVDGIGGIGKTALVLEVSYKYLNNDRTRINENFDAIIWTSAKRTVLTVDGVKQRQQTLRTLDDIYTTISIVLRSEDIIRARSEEQSELVRRALSKQRTLLIVDNLETVDDESVMTFLREIPAPTKVIVTTRHRIDVAYPIRLSDLPWSDARILIDQECKKKNVSLSESEMYTLYSRTSGVPLAIVLTVGKIGFGFSITDTLARLSNPENDIVHYCFSESVNLIRGKPAHQILMALSLFAKPANREILGYVAGLHEYDRDEALVTALKLSLINKKADKFYMLELTRIYCLHELENNSDYANSVIDRAVNHINELLRQTDQKYWFQDQKIILEEGDNIISLFDWALVHNKIAIALSIIKYAVLHLQYVGRRADALNLAWKGIQLASFWCERHHIVDH
jgi:LuxR family glucitol operon transcriptional activator